MFGEEASNDAGWLKMAIFLSVYTFGSFRVQANVTTQYYSLSYWLSTNPKQMILNDLEWAFYHHL